MRIILPCIVAAFLVAGCVDDPPAAGNNAGANATNNANSMTDAGTDTGGDAPDLGGDGGASVDAGGDDLGLADMGSDAQPDMAELVLEIDMPEWVEALTSGRLRVLANGEEIDLETMGTTSSLTPELLEISHGAWRALKPGQAQVKAEYEGASITVNVEVVFEVEDLAVGKEHVCIATSLEGRVYCIGRNDYMQAGVQNDEANITDIVETWHEVPFVDPNSPTGGRRRVVELSAGLSFTCALTVDHLALCWGANYDNQRGVGNGGQTPVPQLVSWTGPLYSLSSGNGHTCAIGEDDAVCWGSNNLEQIAPIADDDLVPRAVGLGAKPTDVTTGFEHSCAIVNGEVVCWGENDDGQANGVTPVDPDTEPPAPQTTLTIPGNLSNLMASDDSTCVVSDGDLWCWGDTSYVGVSGLMGSVTAPFDTGISRVTATSAYEEVMAVLQDDGKVLAWGAGYAGLLGTGSTTDTKAAIIVGNGLLFESIAFGGRNACGITLNTGGLYCWGENDFLLFGANVPSPVLTPQPMRMPWEDL